jgi:cyclopropane-fatty-acyl-phospholipid synthase
MPHKTVVVLFRNFAATPDAVSCSDLGFSEAYMFGEIDISDLMDAFKLFLLNQAALSPSSSLSPSFPILTSIADRLVAAPQAYINALRFTNTIANARSNISAHYDISNDMFAAFLSEDMTYSCAIFGERDRKYKDQCRHVACPNESQTCSDGLEASGFGSDG